MSMRMSDLICQFDGDGNFSEWVEKVELVGHLQGVKDLEKFLPLFLKGVAFAVYKSIPEDEKSCYIKVKERLNNAFSVGQFQAYELFRSRILNAGESVDVYLADLNKLGRLVNEAINDDWIKCAFVAGLPIDIKTQMQASCGMVKMDLSEVVDRARVLTKSGNCDVGFIASSTKPQMTLAKTYVNDGNTRQCYKCGKSGHIAKFCRGEFKDFSKKCYVCGDPDHLAPVCPKKYDSTPKNF